ncbi:MAG: ATP-binding protein [Candidatus Kapaibacteriales bacterium]
MKKFSTYIVGSYFVIVIVFSFILLYIVLNNVREYFTEFQIRNLRDISRIIESEISFNYPEVYKYQNESFWSYLKKLDSLLNVRITIIDPIGNVIFDSRANPKLLDNHISRPEIKDALKFGEGSSIRFSNTIKKEQIYYAHLFVPNDTAKLFIRVSINRDYFATFFGKIQEHLLEIFIVLAATMMVISTLFSKRILQPIEKLINASKKITKGDLNVELAYKDSTEIGELIENFNLMIQKIRNLIEETSFQKNYMKDLINSIELGISIYDEHLNLIFSNYAYNSIFSLNGKINFSAFHFPYKILQTQFLSAFENKAPSNKEISFSGRTYYSCLKILSNNQYLHFVYDVTLIKEIENIKKDLVANVSHELRTPLTAIKGYIETLEETAHEDQKKFIEIIKRNTDRIIFIVNDLLQLMSLEDSSSKLEVSDVNLREICELVVTNFRNKINEKNLNVIIESTPDFPVVRADSFRIEQVFVNLLDNAIKYSEKGTIYISFENLDDEQVRIIFSDEGIGIPEEHLDRIFERFYTVDKSRSKRTGGTGLGLAIVKHIILMHDGNIQVKSQLGKGTTFIIYLPIN